MPQHRVVIVGGGFAGLEAALRLGTAPVDVLLIDRKNHHTFQPLLYQVATGGLSPADISAPIRSLVARHRNTRVRLGEVSGVDVARRRVLIGDEAVPYDTLVVAAGVRHAYFGHDEWERYAPGLKTLEDALEIRRRVLGAFETAERLDDPDARRPWLRFVVVGAGPTGVELAGSLAELARQTLRDDFRAFDPASAEVVLVEGGPRVLPSYDGGLADRARTALEELGVTVRVDTLATEIGPDAVRLTHDGSTETLLARTVLWAAGIATSPLVASIAEQTGAPVDRLGRLRVEADLSVPHHPEVFVVGDAASFEHQGDRPLRGTADVAQAEGRYVARLIGRRVQGGQLAPFRFRDLGKLAVIGRTEAIAELPRAKFSGGLAWLFWLFVHLMKLVTFQNRLTVFGQWGWSFMTRNRSARLITGPEVAQEESIRRHSGKAPRIGP